MISEYSCLCCTNASENTTDFSFSCQHSSVSLMSCIPVRCNRLTCARCNRSFKFVSLRKRHETRCRACGNCNFFGTEKGLTVHKRKHHPPQSGTHFTCNVCNKSFKQSFRRTVHQRTCTSDNPTSYNPQTKPSSKRVRRPATQFECKRCLKIFLRHEYLIMHQRRCIDHELDPASSSTTKRVRRPQLIIKCPQCPRSFNTRDGFTNHRKVKHPVQNELASGMLP